MTTMRNIPMLDCDRELMRAGLEGFDDMTVEEYQAVIEGRLAELDRLITALKRGT